MNILIKKVDLNQSQITKNKQVMKEISNEVKTSILETKVSRFEGTKPAPKGLISYEEIADSIVNPSDWVIRLVEEIRANVDNEALCRVLKHQLPSFAINGVFPKWRKNKGIKIYNDIISIDVDNQPAKVVNELAERLRKDEYVHILFRSPSGNGLKVFYRINDEYREEVQNYIDLGNFDKVYKAHNRAFDALSDWFDAKYQLKSDRSVRPIQTICFMSHDPELYINTDAKIFTIPDIAASSQNKSATSKGVSSNNYRSNNDFPVRELSLIYKHAKGDERNKEGSRNDFLADFSRMAFSDAYTYDEIYEFISPYMTLSDDEVKRTINQASKSDMAKNPKPRTDSHPARRSSLDGALEANRSEKEAAKKGVLESELVLAGLNLRFEFRINDFSANREVRDKLIGDGSWKVLDTLTQNDILSFIRDEKLKCQSNWEVFAFNNSTHRFNPILEYLKGVTKADSSVDYVSQLANLVKTDNDEVFAKELAFVLRAMVSNWLGRSVNENMLIFKGREGVGKTLFCTSLIPKPLEEYLHRYTAQSKDNRELLLAAYQNMIVIYDEIKNFRLLRDHLDGLITQRVISSRPLYSDVTENNPRRASFFGTTNLSTFLTGEEGERRYLVSEMVDCDIDSLLKFDFDSLYAQVYGEVLSGDFNLYHDMEMIRGRRERNLRHCEDNPLEDMISKHCKLYYDENIAKVDKVELISSTDILNHLNQNYKRIDSSINATRIGRYLTSHNVASVMRNNSRKYYVTLI